MFVNNEKKCEIAPEFTGNMNRFFAKIAFQKQIQAIFAEKGENKIVKTIIRQA